MSIASIYNIPRLPEEFLVWSFSNQDAHVAIANAIFAQKGVSLTIYPLDPMPVGGDLASWAVTHQAAHNAQNQALGISGVDLSEVDFNNPGEVAAWIQLHANEHLQAANMLKLGFD